MQRVLSTYLLVNRKLTPSLLGELARAGIPALELFCARPHFDYRSPQEVRGLADGFASQGLALHSVHAPTDRELGPGRESDAPISIADPERVRRLDAVDEVKRALELAEHISFRFLVLHLGGTREPMDPRRWDAAFSSLEHLRVFAKQRGVTLALENTPGELATPANLRRFLAEARLQDLRLCLDTGHAHMEEGVKASFETMGEFIVTTHVHDNRGEKDEHLLPYEGTIDWEETLKLLSGVAGGGLPVVLELREQAAHAAPLEPPALAQALQAVRGVFDRLERAWEAAGAGRAAGSVAG